MRCIILFFITIQVCLFRYAARLTASVLKYRESIDRYYNIDILFFHII